MIILQKKKLNPKRTNQMRSFALHSKELHDLYTLPSFVRTVKCRKVSRSVDRMRETENVCRSLVENLFENVPLEDCKEAGNTKMGLCIGCEDGRWLAVVLYYI
jgi:hypothetical protein